MNILALDLSLVATGWARMLAATEQSGVITTRHTGLARIEFILGTIKDLAGVGGIPAARADLIIMEGPSFGSSSTSTWERAGLRMLVLHTMRAYGVPVIEVAPKTLKKFATGNGNSGKDAMIAAAIRSLGFDKGRYDNNEADAWCLLKMAQLAYDCDGRVARTVYRDEALRKVPWPLVGGDGLTD